MSWLAIDTTGADCTVALRRPDGSERVCSEAIGRGHAERLAPMVAALLQDSGILPGELTRIGVTTGPGSFAGTRVGVAFARGLALATGARCVGLSNLAILARQAGHPPALAVLHDAKRGEVILQVWRAGQSGAPERCPVDAVDARLDALMGPSGDVAGSGACFAGSGYRDLGIETLHATTLLELTGALDPADHPPAPFYARPPDAKLPGGKAPE